MVTDDTESADSTICYVAPKSTRMIPASVKKPKRRRLTVFPNFYFLIPPPHTSFGSVRPQPHPVSLLLTPPLEPYEMRQLPSQRLCRLLVDATHLVESKSTVVPAAHSARQPKHSTATLITPVRSTTRRGEHGLASHRSHPAPSCAYDYL